MITQKAQFFKSMSIFALAGFVTIILQGCLITVKHNFGGVVTSNEGADCSLFCNYQIFQGQNFSETFTATATENSEFVRWNDNLGEGFNLCNLPTTPICRISIPSVVEGLEDLRLNVEAYFRQIGTNNVNLIEYELKDESTGRFFQVSSELWKGTRVDEEGEYFYKLLSRSNSEVQLYDIDRRLTYHINIQSGLVQLEDNQNGLPIDIGKVTHLSGAVNGFLASKITYGSQSGLAAGEFIRVDDERWSQYDRKMATYNTYTVTSRSQDSIVLTSETNEKIIQLDLSAGLVFLLTEGSAKEEMAIIQRKQQPVNGLNTIEVIYKQEDGRILGLFRNSGGQRWDQYKLRGFEPIESYSLVLRGLNKIVLQNRNDRDYTVTIRLDEGKITTSRSDFLGPPSLLFEIAEAR